MVSEKEQGVVVSSLVVVSDREQGVVVSSG